MGFNSHLGSNWYFNSFRSSSFICKTRRISHIVLENTFCSNTVSLTMPSCRFLLLCLLLRQSAEVWELIRWISFIQVSSLRTFISPWVKVVSYLTPLTGQLWNYRDQQKRICTHGGTENVEFMGIKAGLSQFAYGHPEQLWRGMSINSRWLQEKIVLLRIIVGIPIILNQDFRMLGACEQNMLRNGKECFLL